MILLIIQYNYIDIFWFYIQNIYKILIVLLIMAVSLSSYSRNFFYQYYTLLHLDWIVKLFNREIITHFLEWRCYSGLTEKKTQERSFKIGFFGRQNYSDCFVKPINTIYNYISYVEFIQLLKLLSKCHKDSVPRN